LKDSTLIFPTAAWSWLPATARNEWIYTNFKQATGSGP